MTAAPAEAGASLGLAVAGGSLVEKPLARSARELEEFRALQQPDRILVGYMSPSYPQFREAVARLKMGEFGNVSGFEAYSLQSLFPSAKRWEVNPAVSGGGTLINLGGHVLTMIFEAFGLPESVDAQQIKITSRHVEDSMVIGLDYGTFSGTYCTSWTIAGYPQAEFRLLIHTDRGVLYCSSAASGFLNRSGRLEWFCHQQDSEQGFNFSPDYIGGDHDRLRSGVKNRRDP